MISLFYRSPLHVQKPLSRGSENALNRTIPDIGQGKERPMSAYMPQGQPQQGYPGQPMQQQQQGPPARSQSSRDIIRQEAKLQEMQEEVRRRELRGGPGPGSVPGSQMGAYRTNTYNPRAGAAGLQQNAIRQGRPLGSTPNLGPTSPNYGRQPGQNYAYPPDAQYNQQYGQFNKQQQQYAGAMSRQYGQNGPQYPNGPETEIGGGQYTNAGITRSHTEGDMASDNPPARPALPNSSSSPPPPVPNTMTHPLFNKQLDPSSR